MKNANLPKICHFFNNPSGCNNGDACFFTHEKFPTSSESRVVPPYMPAPAQVDQRHFCRFFASPDGCRNGYKCQYRHQLLPGEEMPTITAPPITKILTRHLNGPFFSIDVECIATGYGHEDRAVARIAMVDDQEAVIFDEYVMPDEPIVSCLTALTGIEMHHLENHGLTFASAMDKLKSVLPPSAIFVGQSIQKDIGWLKLEQGLDFADSFDVAQLFRVWNGPKAHKRHPFRYYSLRHVAKYLMHEDIQLEDHDPVVDAQYSMKVFLRYRHLHENQSYFRSVQQTLRATPRTPSFAERVPFIDNVAISINSKVPKSKIMKPQIPEAEMSGLSLTPL